MKELKDFIGEAVVDGIRGQIYTVALTDVLDREGLPITVKIVCPGKYLNQFEEWVKKQEGNIFMHAEGGMLDEY